MNAKGLRIGLVGPLPPPSGGMANQTRQLAALLREEGAMVELVQVNPPYPSWIANVRWLRAPFRLLPYLVRLWRAAGKVQLFHIMANSGWSWHLTAAPAIWVGKLRGVSVIVNYHGGGAEEFLERSFYLVRLFLLRADAVVVPSGFLERVFAKRGIAATVVPNIVDLTQFSNHGAADPVTADRPPHIIVTRNLESIYDIGTALRALAIVRNTWPGARMTVAGSGPEREKLAELAQALGLAAHVTFTGRLDNDRIGALYQHADLFLNPSLVDNMPISILEALASGVPVVSTNVGGIPFVVEHQKTALLVPTRDPEAMARAALDLLDDPAKAARLASAGRESVQQYAWQNVRERLFGVYSGLAPGAVPNAAAETK